MAHTGELRAKFEMALQEHIVSLQTPLELVKPMVYSLNGGGKRLRPLLLLTALNIKDPKLVEKGLKTSIALEYIHTYSLIHDDLPAMDNDDMRRGQPTSHIKFDEATAILAGDALETDAFGIIANDNQLSEEKRLQLILELSFAAGSNGMVAGQLYDINSDGQKITLEELKKIHLLKTGYLFMFAVKAAAIISGADSKEKDLLNQFGNHYGVAYQIHNDLKDVVNIGMDQDSLLHSDEANGKTTYPTLLGIDGAKEALLAEIDACHRCLKILELESKLNYQGLAQFLKPLSIEK